MSHDSSRDAAALALLRWYVDAGVDETIGDVPVDRMRPAARPAAAAPAAAPPSQPAEPPRAAPPPTAPLPTAPAATRAPAAVRPPPPGLASGRASGLALDAPDDLGDVHDLEALRARVEAFEGCSLRFTATNTVFGVGNPRARLMLIGEAPGAEEDRLGYPFVGPSGHLLDRMLAAIGLDRSSVYIANVLYWRPPGNRTPTPAEFLACRPFLHRQIELVDPAVLMLLGGASTKALLERPEGITRLRGRWTEIATRRTARPYPVLPTFHPAFLLRSPDQKRQSWRDLLAVRERLDGLSGDLHTRPASSTF